MPRTSIKHLIALIFPSSARLNLRALEWQTYERSEQISSILRLCATCSSYSLQKPEWSCQLQLKAQKNHHQYTQATVWCKSERNPPKSMYVRSIFAVALAPSLPGRIGYKRSRHLLFAARMGDPNPSTSSWRLMAGSTGTLATGLPVAPNMQQAAPMRIFAGGSG